MGSKAKIIAVAGKGGVGKTSISAAIVKVLVSSYPGARILAIDADPAVGLSTALGIEVESTIDDIRKAIIENVEDGNTRDAIELLSESRYRIFDTMVEKDGFAFIAVGRPDDIQGKSIFNLPEDSNVIIGATEALKKINIV